MTDLRRCVVLDTNAYRRLARRRPPTEARRKGTGIRTHDQRQGVQAIAHPLVIVELLAHLSDPEDPSRDECRCAIITLWEHCATTLGGTRQIAILEDPETQLAVALYRCCPIANHRLVENLAHTARLIGETDADDVLTQLQDTLRSCVETVESIEENFVRDMAQFVVQGFDPTARSWDAIKRNPDLLTRVISYLESEQSLTTLARAKVALARHVVGRDLSVPVHNDEVETVINSFKCHLELYRRIVRTIVERGPDVTKPKKRNWVWDLQIAFSLGEYTVRNGLSMDLVTGDIDIVEAANAAGFGDRVISVDQYSARLRQQ